MRRPNRLPIAVLALGLTLSVAGLAQPPASPEAQAKAQLLEGVQAATANGSGCDVAFLQEYVYLVSSQMADQAPAIYSKALSQLKTGPERECLRDTLKSLGLSPQGR